MLYPGTDPESNITEYTLVYEDQLSLHQYVVMLVVQSINYLAQNAFLCQSTSVWFDVVGSTKSLSSTSLPRAIAQSQNPKVHRHHHHHHNHHSSEQRCVAPQE